MLTPEQRIMRARIAASKRWGRTPKPGRDAQAAAMRQGKLTKYLAEVDAENPGLSDVERHQLAAAKERAYMTGLAFQSSKARGSRKASAA